MPGLPWEQPGLDFFSRFFDTLRLLITRPRQAFERMSVTGGIGRPLLFATLIAWPAVLTNTLWEIALREQLSSFRGAWGDSRYDIAPGMQIAVAACTPLWLPIVLLIGSAIQHLSLMMIGGARSGYIATFRVACYSQAASVLAFIPVCGSLLSGVWNLILIVVGLSAAHRVGTGRAALAVLLPIILCCACISLILMFGGAAWLASMRGGGD